MIHEWHAANDDLPPCLYWAMRWGPSGERSARAAWEASMKYARNTHVWRLKQPVEPPHQFHCVIALGDLEGRASLERMLMAAGRVAGGTLYELDGNFVRALVLRRLRMMAERLAEGDFGMKVNRTSGFKLRPDGTIFMTDWFDSAEWKRYQRHVLEEMLPKLETSSIAVSLVPDGEGDVKFWVELGAAIMLDKPIVAVTHPGADVPPKLRLVADEIIEADMSAPNGAKELSERIALFLERRFG